MKTFTLTANVSTDNRKAIKLVLEKIFPKESMKPAEEGFLVQATLEGESARELNRELLSRLRRVERKTRMRAEWRSRGKVERFFDYVPKSVKGI
ncbi:MAG TPA: hypothetical protein VLX91_00605 [Candidatus Acidoferrales bacterium]|nr:hypothetical protein [Candidatus Acidoferrales bacterium]